MQYTQNATTITPIGHSTKLKGHATTQAPYNSNKRQDDLDKVIADIDLEDTASQILKQSEQE